MFVARPIASYLCTLPARFTVRESTLLGWAGLRGAVPIVLATFPVIEGVPNADPFFNIVFFVVLTSTLIQGVTFEPLARALRLTTERAGDPAAAGRGRHDPAARRRGDRVPRRATTTRSPAGW